MTSNTSPTSSSQITLACVASFVAGSVSTYLLLRRRSPRQEGGNLTTTTTTTAHPATTTPAAASTTALTTLAPTSSADFKTAGNSLLDWIVGYRTDCRDLPVMSTVPHNYLKDVLPESAPEQPESWSTILGDLDTKIVPGLTHWEASNKFFAYFKPHASYPAVLGELVCAGLNVMGFDWVASPACTELEVITLDWLAQILNLPARFFSKSKGPGGAVIQGSAGESCLVVLLAAILRKQKQNGGELPCARNLMVVYGSDQTHTIVKKACRILGVRYHVLATSEANGYGLQATEVQRAVEDDMRAGLVPIAVVATIGTTSSCAMDDVAGISKVCATFGLWHHIDAAYGGAYLCLDECSDLRNGLDGVDSFCVNCHKKLLCPFDLAALYLADRGPVIHALSIDSEYLRNEHSESGAVVDYENWQLPLGRRFRALKLWFVLRRFGAEGIRGHVRKGMQLRKVVGDLVRADGRFEIAAKPSLSLLCFKLAGRSNSDQQRLLASVKATGECFIIHTKLGDQVVLRFACGGVEQTEDDVRKAWAVIAGKASELFG